MIKVRETIERDILGGGYASHAALSAASSLYDGRPIPLPILNLCRRLTRNRDALMPRKGLALLDPREIPDTALGRLLAGRSFDEWSINHEVVRYLLDLCTRVKPEAIIEFGSGISTLAFAGYFGALDGPAPRIVSVDQSEAYAGATRRDLAVLGLDHLVEIHVAPLAETRFDTASVDCYGLDKALLSKIFSRVTPQLVFIDGPFGQGPVRGPILPAILPYLEPGTLIVLDDALRDNEMQILVVWHGLPRVRVDGVRRLRAGLAEIRIAAE